MGGVRQRAMTTTLPKLIQSLRKECPKPRIKQLPSLRRAFSLYDQINLIDNVPEDQLRFQGYTDTGFRVNGVEYEGSLLCVGNLLTSWAPSSFSQITPDSLSIFQIVRPIPGERVGDFNTIICMRFYRSVVLALLLDLFLGSLHAA
ncbi:hypothetical protein H0E87_025138 [Populus deltoides]|uniref:Uncharacterized protein n=1 Tax=Populus deltoides TaxID=3696 RepID=A0A8T2XAK0_POPDE|nr:hypothetical protein H0E87_025138 [Populus deltoides]